LLNPARLEKILSSVPDRRQQRTDRKQQHIAESNKRAIETDLRIGRLCDANLDNPELNDRISELKATRDPAARCY
jgi:site-specific DNA recombinase